MNQNNFDVKSRIADVIAWLQREPLTAATKKNHARAQILKVIFVSKRGAGSRLLASLHALTRFAGAGACIQATEAELSEFAELAPSSVSSAVNKLTDAAKPYVIKYPGPRDRGGVPTGNVLKLTATFEEDIARLKANGLLSIEVAIAKTIASWFDPATGVADIASAKILAAGAGSRACPLDEAAVRSTVGQMIRDGQLACVDKGLLTFADWLDKGRLTFTGEPFRRTRSRPENVDGSGDELSSKERKVDGSGDGVVSGEIYKSYINSRRDPSWSAPFISSTTATMASPSPATLPAASSSSLNPSALGGLKKNGRASSTSSSISAVAAREDTAGIAGWSEGLLSRDAFMATAERAIADDGGIAWGDGLRLVRTALAGVINPRAVKDDGGVGEALKTWLDAWDKAGRDRSEAFEFLWTLADREGTPGNTINSLRWFTTAMTGEAAKRATWPRLVPPSVPAPDVEMITLPSQPGEADDSRPWWDWDSDPDIPLGSSQWAEAMSWASGEMAYAICLKFLEGIRQAPDLSDVETTSITLQAMAHGILANPEPSDDAIEVVKLAASRHSPTIVFGIIAEALAIQYETGCRMVDWRGWSDVTTNLANVLVRATDDELVLVPRPTSSAVDELAQARNDDEMADVTQQDDEANDEQNIWV